MSLLAADQLKEKGNDAFRRGEYAVAEDFYTQAIQKYSRNPLIFTNRANARLKLLKWEDAVHDCLKSIEITGPSAQNHKAYYFLAQAQLSLNHPNEALSSAMTAYNQVLHPAPGAKVSQNDMQTFSAFVLKCKKAKFTQRERSRLQRQGDLLADLEDALETKKIQDEAEIAQTLHRGQISPLEARERCDELASLHETRLSGLRAVFSLAQDPSSAPPRREVPDHIVDMITFEPMHDPVITKNGHSYERATLFEHLKRNPTDPMTREPLTIVECRNNFGLKAACEAFWESGAQEWIGDW